MEKFGENFRGVKGPIICPLCETHLDNQAQSLQCPVIKQETNMEDTHRDIQDLYQETISLPTIKVISDITKTRKKLINV